MSEFSSEFFDPAWLTALATAAAKDDFVAQHSTLAAFTIGFRNTESGETAWISVNDSAIDAGTNDTAAAFLFAGDTAAFSDLKDGFPFNRLVRQHRLSVEGDLRGCVQNWLLIYAILRLASSVEY